MQNYDTIVYFLSYQALYDCVVLMERPSILGYIRFALKLGNKYLPVEALVLPHLGPDAKLIDSIMKALLRNKTGQLNISCLKIAI